MRTSGRRTQTKGETREANTNKRNKYKEEHKQDGLNQKYKKFKCKINKNKNKNVTWEF